MSEFVKLQEAIAVGKSFSSIKGYHIDGNKEMMSMGFMNIVGSLTSCYVATGKFDLVSSFPIIIRSFLQHFHQFSQIQA